MIATDAFEKVHVISAAHLRTWLMENHRQTASVWLVLTKKHVGSGYVSIGEVLDELLCFGWVDGIARKVDDTRSLRLISPRRTQLWAKSYKDRAARLIEEGRMHSAGIAAIAESKRRGLWAAMDDVDALEMPEDLTRALAGGSAALANFHAFSQSSRRNVLRWIKLAKTPTTRAKRIAQTTMLAEQNKKVPQMGGRLQPSM
jgi:uncharacterized protein YdeI (YjbR/CyaY-like superfamily)